MSSIIHEEGLSAEALNIHRALASVQEELEAVDWYNQRADVTQDAELKSILEHNRNEEIEHACMVLEWLRRNMPEFDQEMKTYFFKSAPITQIEDAEADEEGDDAPETSNGNNSLGIGNLR